MDSKALPISEERDSRLLAIAENLAVTLRELATRKPIQPETTGPAPHSGRLEIVRTA